MSSEKFLLLAAIIFIQMFLIASQIIPEHIPTQHKRLSIYLAQITIFVTFLVIFFGST